MDRPRPLRGIAFLIGFAAVLASASPARACTRPYESAERVLSRACYIFEVEVTSVGPIEGEKGADSAKARVRILKELRGRMPMREFTLLGGPYDSCAFFDQYVSFTKGDQFFLFLEYFLAIDAPADGMAVVDAADRFLAELDTAESPLWLADLFAVASSGGVAALPHLDRLRTLQ